MTKPYVTRKAVIYSALALLWLAIVISGTERPYRREIGRVLLRFVSSVREMVAIRAILVTGLSLLILLGFFWVHAHYRRRILLDERERRGPGHLG